MIHEFAPPPAGATLHATDGATRYLRVDWIMRQEMGGTPTYYCAAADWETTPAGRLAAKDAEIALLRGWVDDLKAQLALVSNVPPAVADAAAGMESDDAALSDDAGGGRRRALPAKEPCPDCEKLISPWQMERHRQTHSKPSPSLIVPAWPPVRIVEEVGDWRCAACGSDAHARSLNHPDVCLRCASKVSANGHKAAV